MGHCLILISCSNLKKVGEEKEYTTEDSILSIIDNGTKRKLIEKRKYIFGLVRSGKIEDQLRVGRNRKDDSFNLELQDGPDISGISGCKEISSLYMPAYKRYFGRFFANADMNTFEKAIALRYHTLIVSGLYGLITLREPIQAYTCHLDDAVIPSDKDSTKYDKVLSEEIKARVSDLWKGIFDELLLQYIHYHNEHNGHKITKVIDLLSEYSYQRIFQWEKLSKRFKDDGIKIYHRVVPNFKEPNSLPQLGKYYRDEILAGSGDFKTTLEKGEKIYFTEELQPDPYFEEKLKAEMTDEVWKRLDKENRKELIQAENLYHIFMARPGVGLEEKADRNMHYFIAVENELWVIFREIIKKDGSKGQGTIGEYLYHLKEGELRGPLPNRGVLLRYLSEICELRNAAGHPKGITKRQLIRAREILLGERERKGLLAMLMDVKSFKNPLSSFQNYPS